MQSYKWHQLIPLREKNSEQYQPSEQQILEYAQYIGIQLPQDQSLLYLAHQGIISQLPQQWQACQAPNGEMLYRNKITKVIQDEHPLDELYRKKVLFIKESQIEAYYHLDSHNTDQLINSQGSYDLKDSQHLPAIEQQGNEMSDSAMTEDQSNKAQSQLNPFEKQRQKINELKEKFSSSYYLNSRNDDIKFKSRQMISSQLGSRDYQANSQFQRNMSEKYSNFQGSSSNLNLNLNLNNLNKNISSTMRNKSNNKMLPSSLFSRSKESEENYLQANLKLSKQEVTYNQNQLIKTKSQEFEDYQFIKKLSSYKSRSSEEENQLVVEIKRMEKQKELKKMLLEQLRQNNRVKMQLLKSKMNKEQKKKMKQKQKDKDKNDEKETKNGEKERKNKLKKIKERVQTDDNKIQCEKMMKQKKENLNQQNLEDLKKKLQFYNFKEYVF